MGLPRVFWKSGRNWWCEIISPGDRRQEVQQKLAEYFALGVEQVWVVEPETRALLVYYSPAEIRRFTEEDKLITSGASDLTAS